jgi:hypothetical protein
VKDSLYNELALNATWNIFLGDFSAIVGREDISKLTTGNEKLQESSNDNGVRVVNFASSKNFSQKYDVPTS